MSLAAAVLLVGLVASAAASIAGAGIGSTLAPLMSLQVGLKLAIAATAIPHLCASVIRFGLTYKQIDQQVFLRFGLVSAVSSLVGAWLHATTGTRTLTALFGILLILAGLWGLAAGTWQIQIGRYAWAVGALSGFLGGLVGEQGGFRSVALLGFHVPKETFIATATAIGLIVDVARVPVYLLSQGPQMLAIWPLIGIASTAVIIGTLIGYRFLQTVPEAAFSRVVSGIILVIGCLMLV